MAINARRPILALLLLAVAPFTAAAEIRTYQFIEDQPRDLEFRGGLMDIGVASLLIGSFDVTIDDDGTSRLTRFDVLMTDLLEFARDTSGFTEGLSLGPILFVNPVGLTGRLDGKKIILGAPHIDPHFDPDCNCYVFSNRPSGTVIEIIDNADRTATLFMSSSPAGEFDIPGFRTSLAGTQVRLVPEPTGLALLSSGLIALASARAIRRRK